MLQVFGDFELDGDQYELRRGGQPVKLEPKVFSVLSYLIARCDRVVSKQELFENLWPGEFVTDAALTYCIKAACRAVGDDGARQRVIATIQRRGYRFVAALKRDDSRQTPSKAGHATEPIGAEAPFIGRERVLARLERMLASAAGGRGGLVLLAGEPGIGKTRTCDELARLARGRNVPVLIGRCYEGEGAPPFWPWVQILRAHLRDVEPSQLASVLGRTAGDLAQLLPELADRLPVLPPRPDEQTPQSRVQLFESVWQMLDSTAWFAPTSDTSPSTWWAPASARWHAGWAVWRAFCMTPTRRIGTSNRLWPWKPDWERARSSRIRSTTTPSCCCDGREGASATRHGSSSARRATPTNSSACPALRRAPLGSSRNRRAGPSRDSGTARS